MDNASVGRRQPSDSSPEESSPDGESAQPSRFSKDTLFAILENQRRRDTLRYLRANGGTATLGDLAEHIAARENGVDVAGLSSDERKRVYIALYQCHLPKMSSAGVVDFDKNRGTIELRAEAGQFDAYLDDDVGDEAGTVRRNLAIAGGLAASLVASVVGVPGFVLVPELAWAVLSTVTLLVLTLADTRLTPPPA
jgi:hypothetical protein